jgi:hypothetical protein
MTAAAMPPALDLLLAHADDGAPALAGGLADDAVHRAAPPARLPDAHQLRNRGRDPNDLVEQRWALIVPEGEAGARLVAAVAPLVERRRAQQGGHPVQVYRVPPRMDAGEAARWHREVYLDERVAEADLPFYQLILGDLDQVPLAVQQVQMIDGVVGRLAFDDPAGYEAYVAKLLGWEDRPAAIPRARSLFHAVHDGTSATASGYQALISPALAAARADRELGRYDAADVVELGDPGRAPSRDDLLAAAAAADPAVLLGVGHGQGAPRRGWRSADDQRRLQGALSFGADGALAGSDLAGRRYLPGGVWFLLACYSAGTPDASAYRPWLERLRDLGQYGERVDAVLRSLPAAGERPFIAALPRAALASPDGPIAFVGHIDLAWSYSFQELDASGPKNRLRRFLSLLGYVLRRDRIGVAFRELVSCALAADTELLTLYARQAIGPALDPADQARVGHLWMLRQDLLGYVLLGDPAARLPIAPPAIAASPTPPAINPADLFSFALGAPASPPPAPSPPTPTTDGDPLEKAILALLAGNDPQALATEHRIARSELERLAQIYRDAGRAALAAHRLRSG